jgi:hypothetical protein
MTFSIPSPDEALVGLRTMKTVVTAAGPPDLTRSALISASQKYVLRTDHDFDELEPSTPETLAEVNRSPGGSWLRSQPPKHRGLEKFPVQCRPSRYIRPRRLT